MLEKIYSDMTEYQYTERDQWLSFIINLFQRLGMTHVWDNQFNFNADRLKCTVLGNVQDRFNQFWQESKEENQLKMIFYTTTTQGQTYRIEPYLLVDTKPEYRKTPH